MHVVLIAGHMYGVNTCLVTTTEADMYLNVSMYGQAGIMAPCTIMYTCTHYGNRKPSNRLGIMVADLLCSRDCVLVRPLYSLLDCPVHCLVLLAYDLRHRGAARSQLCYNLFCSREQFVLWLSRVWVHHTLHGERFDIARNVSAC